MTIEIEMIISTLKLTKTGTVSQISIKNNAHLPLAVVQKMLRKMQAQGLLYLEGEKVRVSGPQRMRLTVQALRAGADFERVSSCLNWREFEDITATILEEHGYSVVRSLHFKYRGRRSEIDVVGSKTRLVVCIDCKHWHRRLHTSAIRRIVEEQVKRTSALAESLPNLRSRIHGDFLKSLAFVPVVLSLRASRFRFYEKTPVVPILQLQDFLSQLPAHIDALKHFKTE